MQGMRHTKIHWYSVSVKINGVFHWNPLERTIQMQGIRNTKIHWYSVSVKIKGVFLWKDYFYVTHKI